MGVTELGQIHDLGFTTVDLAPLISSPLASPTVALSKPNPILALSTVPVRLAGQLELELRLS